MDGTALAEKPAEVAVLDDIAVESTIAPCAIPKPNNRVPILEVSS
jgi:hypothetical protein